MEKAIKNTTKIYNIIFFIFFLHIQSCGRILPDFKPSAVSSTSTSSIPSAITESSVKGTIELFAENLVSPVNISPLPHLASIGGAYGIALDPSGNLYIGDSENNLIRKVDTAGNMTTFAGTGVSGSTDGFRTSALFDGPGAIIFDPAGNMYVSVNSAVRKIDTLGMVTTIAGLANNPGTVDGNGASARFNKPAGLAFDASTNMLYVADQANNNIRRIDPLGNVITFAGSTIGTAGAVDGVGTAATFDLPGGIVLSYGYLYVADQFTETIRQIDVTTANVVTFAGASYIQGGNDGPALGTATFYHPIGVSADPAGNLYVSGGSQTVRMITTSGTAPPITATTVSTIAGTGAYGSNDGAGLSATFNNLSTCLYSPDGNLYLLDTGNYTIRKLSTTTWVVSTAVGTATIKGSEDTIGPRTLIPSFSNPLGVGVDPAGNIYVGDTGNHLLRKITPAREVTTLAGSKSVQNFVDGMGSAALFNGPRGILVSTTGDIYVADSNNNAIRKVTPSGSVSTLASGSFNYPVHMTEDSAHNIYVADFSNNIIQKVDPLGNVTPFAGTGVASSVDGDKNSVATFNRPSGVAFDSKGDMYVTEWLGSVVRKITLSDGSNLVSTFAGLGPVTFNYLMGITIDKYDNLYVPDAGNHVIRKIDPYGNVTTFAGAIGVPGTADGIGTAARFNSPQSITIDLSGNIYVGDSYNSTIRKITSAGVVSTYAGTPAATGAVDSIVSASQFLTQGGITKGPDGSVYVVDTFNQVIRKITPDGATSILAGSGTQGHADGNGVSASFKYPQGITITKSGNLYVADTFNHTIRQITPAGVVSTFAGMATLNGLQDGIGTAAQFNYPQGITADSNGNLYIADTINTVVRKITASGVVSTVAGNSLIPGGYLDGSLSVAKFGYLKDISLDSSGNIYTVDIGNSVIRKITSFLGIAQNVQTLAAFANIEKPNSFNFQTAPAVVALSSDSKGNIYTVDYVNSLIYKVDTQGAISTIAGSLQTSELTLGSLPGKLAHPSSIYVDSTGINVVLYVLENNSIVKINLQP